jgi:hypothetical protein
MSKRKAWVLQYVSLFSSPLLVFFFLRWCSFLSVPNRRPNKKNKTKDGAPSPVVALVTAAPSSRGEEGEATVAGGNAPVVEENVEAAPLGGATVEEEGEAARPPPSRGLSPVAPEATAAEETPIVGDPLSRGWPLWLWRPKQVGRQAMAPPPKWWWRRHRCGQLQRERAPAPGPWSLELLRGHPVPYCTVALELRITFSRG